MLKLELEPTTQVVTINGATVGRVWHGKTDAGVPVQAVIVSVACASDQTAENERLSHELTETKQPCPEPRAFDMRFVI